MAKKPMKYTSRRKLEPGGLRSLDLTQELLANRKPFLDFLKNPKNLERFLESQKIKGVEYARVKLSENFPGVIIFVKKPFGLTDPFGSANIVEVPKIGKVAVTMMHLSDKKISEHEDAHIWTDISRYHLREGIKPTQKRLLEERLLSELISKTAEGNLGFIFNLYTNIIWPFAYNKVYKSVQGDIKKVDPQKIKDLADRWFDTLANKATAIRAALGQMPKGEVIMVLRKSSWANLEKDLQRRIKLRSA